MKRRRINVGHDDGTYPYVPNPHIYALPPLESTMVLDTSGNFNASIGGYPNNGLGYQGDIPIGTSVRGCKSIQYNNAIWQNDLFTYNYSNALTGLVVTYVYRNLAVSTSYAYTTCIIPLFVARGKRVILCNDASQTLDYSDTQHEANSQQNLQGQNLAYELNLRFAGAPSATGWNSRLKNSICLTKGGFIDMYNQANFPLWYSPATTALFQNNATPIRFYQLPSANGNGGQLVVAKNPDCVPISVQYTYEVWMNFVDIRSYMAIPFFNTTILNTSASPQIAYPRPQMMGEERGWTGQGPHVFGIGTWNADMGTYVDDYHSDEGRALYNFCDGYTTHGTNNYTQLSGVLQNTYQLRNSYLIAPRCMGFCPSRYYLICSEAITRNQRIPFLTNSKSQTGSKSKACIGLLYTHLTSIPPNQNQGMEFNETFPVIGMRANENRDSLDWQILDEWGNYIQTLDTSNSPQNTFLLQFEQAKQLQPPNTALIPAYFQSLNPLPTINSTGQPLCGFENVNENGYCLTTGEAASETIPVYNVLNDTTGYDYMYPCTSKMAHFIRILGLVQ